jgi:DNA-binding NarL/FixJ family response regulator
MIGNLLHVSAGLKTELQFFATTRRSSDGTASLLPQAVELIDDCIRHAKSITTSSQRYFSADAPRLQLDHGIAANRAHRSVHGGGEQWRQMLSQRQHEVLKLLSDCKSNKDIAGEMNISVRTAETYRARVVMKLQLRSIGFWSALRCGTIL